MNINVYLEDDLGEELNQWVKETGKSRNMIIREAVRAWVRHHEAQAWPDSILNFKGLKDAPRFESSRKELKPPQEDIFND